MTQPPSPLADLLETVRQVRMALAYVPKLCTQRKYAEARDVIDEQLVQLAELLPEASRLAGVEGQAQIDQAVRVAGAAAVLVAVSEGEYGELKTRPLSAPGGLPRTNPDIGFADQPLW